MPETPQSQEKKSGAACMWCTKIVKPVNMENLAFHYGPMFGLANYTALSINVMNPRMIMRVCPNRDVTNVLLATSIVGSALYVYDRQLLKSATPQIRVLYSGFGAVLFNFGSVLVWAVLKSTTKSNCIATIMGLLTGMGMATLGRNCLHFIDSKTSNPSK